MAGTGGYRYDIQGLRGVAVLIVVLFHAGLGFPGGFVGVDVFFVISGFVISRGLITEADREGRVSLRQFYARACAVCCPLGCDADDRHPRHGVRDVAGVAAAERTRDGPAPRTSRSRTSTCTPTEPGTSTPSTSTIHSSIRGPSVSRSSSTCSSPCSSPPRGRSPADGGGSAAADERSWWWCSPRPPSACCVRSRGPTTSDRSPHRSPRRRGSRSTARSGGSGSSWPASGPGRWRGIGSARRRPPAAALSA